MNINPYGLTIPHYDSYEDFYKFFEIPPKDGQESIIPIKVFPPVEPMQIKKQEKIVEPEQN
ncbi:MAG: hypothetical protein ABIJ81_02790 [Patescibacteria group bacterium]